MGNPELFGDNLIWSVVGLGQLYVRLGLDSVEIFVETVQKEVDELLGVVLVHALEHDILLADLSLHLRRSDNIA